MSQDNDYKSWLTEDLEEYHKELIKKELAVKYIVIV